jgi:hypothetical protein
MTVNEPPSRRLRIKVGRMGIWPRGRIWRGCVEARDPIGFLHSNRFFAQHGCGLWAEQTERRSLVGPSSHDSARFPTAAVSVPSSSATCRTGAASVSIWRPLAPKAARARALSPVLADKASGRSVNRRGSPTAFCVPSVSPIRKSPFGFRSELERSHLIYMEKTLVPRGGIELSSMLLN